MGCQAFLQGTFPTQGSNPCLVCLLHYRQILYPLRHLGSPYCLGHVLIGSQSSMGSVTLRASHRDQDTSCVALYHKGPSPQSACVPQSRQRNLVLNAKVSQEEMQKEEAFPFYLFDTLPVSGSLGTNKWIPGVAVMIGVWVLWPDHV